MQKTLQYYELCIVMHYDFRIGNWKLEVGSWESLSIKNLTESKFDALIITNVTTTRIYGYNYHFKGVYNASFKNDY